MEKQTKHRILGVFVMIALVIILLPLFQSGKELPSEKVIVKAPPFPDQSLQVASTPDASEPMEAEMDSTPNNDLMGVSRPSVISSQSVASNTVANVAVDEINQVNKVQEPPKVELENKAEVKELAPVFKDKNMTTRVRLTKKNENSLINLKQRIWVIQIGSFKNKTNALQLANKLRAHGYQAFIQQSASAFGGNTTRVFVGPESKQNAARALASRLENQLHIKGVVLNYKPLTL
jgi:DedD protein